MSEAPGLARRVGFIYTAVMPAVLILLSVFASGDAVLGDPPRTANWPSFRGPSASGVADGFPTLERWDVEFGRGVRWKTPVPGLGLSSPVVWGDRLFVTTAIREGEGEGKDDLKTGIYGDITPVDDDVSHRFEVVCLDTQDGKVLWQRTAHRGAPRIKRHPKSSHANPTPATDGDRVVAFFGSEGLHCYTVEGELVWRKDLGVLDSGFFRVPQAQWGFGSSPVIHEGRVIVQCDVQKDSFLAALDVRDGRELWRTPRNEVPTWSTPTVVAVDGEGGARSAQVIVNGYRHIGGYDLADGREIWRMRGGGDIPVPTPVTGHGLVFITNSHGGGVPIYAVRLSASGDVSLEGDATSNAHVAWSVSRRGNYLQTPLVLGDHLYLCHYTGILSCYEARSGKRLYRERVGAGGSGYTASIVAADGKLYVVGEEGAVEVLRVGPTYEHLATNELGEQCMATPAIAGGVIYFRGRRHVIAVGAKAEE